MADHEVADTVNKGRYLFALLHFSTVSKRISEWKAADAVNNPDRWIHRLNTEEIEGLDHALRATLAKGHKSCETMTKDDFPLNKAASDMLELVLDKLENDMGMYVLRGIPVQNYTKDEMRMMYWGLGLHMGTSVSQSGKGDYIGDVKNFGDNISAWSHSGRGYMSRKRLEFHSDSADVVSLLVLNTAKEGGLSKICSAIAVRNEIARKRPDLLKVLYEDFYWSWKGYEKKGERPWYHYPMYSEQDGRFSCRKILPHIFSGQDFPDVPRLTDKQKEALAYIDEVTNDETFYFSMMFEPGDIQFLNNHITHHARSEFVDGDTMETRRHLLRLWLAPNNSRPLSPRLKDFYKDGSPGAVRGGFPCPTGAKVYETVAVDV